MLPYHYYHEFGSGKLYREALFIEAGYESRSDNIELATRLY